MEVALDFEHCFPIWNKLNPVQKNRLLGSLITCQVNKGTILHNGSSDCSGLFLIQSGQLRAYILSDEGREITVYRLFDRDMCLLSASCMIHSIQFEIIIEAEKDTRLWLIPTETYKSLMEESAAAANYTNELMASRFTDVMWLMEQIMWKSLDKRVAAFLLEESSIEKNSLRKTSACFFSGPFLTVIFLLCCSPVRFPPYRIVGFLMKFPAAFEESHSLVLRQKSELPPFHFS